MFKSSFTLPLLRILAATALTTVFGLATAKTLSGEVVGLADGDTVTVLDDAKSQHKVRLAGIDAPERKQPFGNASRQNLAALVFRKHVVVDWKKTDLYGRIVGKVLVNNVDVGLEQVRAGMAWHYKAYAQEQEAADRDAYRSAEEDARAGRVGVWLDGAPVPPWEYRKSLRAAIED